MKKIKTLLLLLLMFAGKGFAQKTALQLMSEELRLLFSNVTNPHPQVGFMYDLSGHFVDSVFFNHYVTDTSNVENWFSLYREEFYMAYDTTQVLSADDVYNLIKPQMQSDTIPIGLIDWDFNLLAPKALTTGNYFQFDTINNLLYDIPGAPNPFTVQTTFAGAALRKTYPFTNPVFMINPAWFFKDSYKNYYATEYQLKIDFGDGTGWHVFTSSSIQHYQANYATGGKKTIQFGIFLNGVLTRYSLSTFKITTNNPMITPTICVTTIPGITASFFEPTGCNLNTDKKYVIYLEGFDPMNQRHASQIYQEMIVDPEISQLKNFGYTFVVVDWNDGNAPLIQNANSVVALLDYLKCLSHSSMPPPFVMIGESMGGLIARYALCYMESPQYNGCHQPVAHNVRLLMTIDAPHQGANVPMGLQYLYRYGTAGTLSLVGFSPWVIGNFSQELLALDGAATEMLKYHVSTDPFITVPVSIAPVFPHPNKLIFDAALANLGNYPRYCKIVALSNGSWLGEHQLREWDNAPRHPNDKIIDINSEVYLKVLGIKILGTKFNLEVKTNPAGTGQVFFTGIGISHWKIKLKWFGAKLVWWTTYPLQINKNVIGVEPYCVMPASNNQLSTGIGSKSGFNSFNLLDIFGFQYSSGSGNLNVQGNLGISFFGSANLNFNAYSDGADFGFIPTGSSFDYDRQSDPLDFSILSHSVTNTMSRTPFDVVVTNPTRFNKYHLAEENPYLQVCQTCTILPSPPAHPVTSFLLNREIGDDTLLLENFRTIYQTPIEAERDIMVNERSNYYNYPNQLAINPLYNINTYSPISSIPGAVVLSKEDPMDFSAAPGLLRSNDNIWVNPMQPPIGPYSWTQNNMTICCINYNFKIAQPPSGNIPIDEAGNMVVYPNPAQDYLTIKYQMTTKDKVIIIVYDMMGKRVVSWQPPFEDNSQVCHYPIRMNEINWSNGLYMVEVTNGNETYRSKLAISK